MKKYLPYVGSILVLFGMILIYLFLFGKNIFYTQTYAHVKNVIKPTLDLEFLIVTFTIVLNLWMFAFLPRMKFGLVFELGKNEKLRKVIRTVTSIMIIGIGILIVVGFINQDWKLINGIVPIFLLILIGGFSMFFLFYSVSPRVTETGRFLLTPIGRGISFIASIVLSLLIVFSVEIVMANDKAEFKEEPIFSDNSQILNKPNYSISAILSEKPLHVNSGESIPIEVKFRLTRFDSTETVKRYPIHLDATKQYLAKMEVQTVGFEVSKLPEELKKPQEAEINKLLNWNWIISPKENKEGTKQLISFHLFLLDKATKELVFSTPITSLNITVDTPLGLPKWLVSPSLSIGAILGGLIAILLPWFLENKTIKIEKEMKAEGNKA